MNKNKAINLGECWGGEKFSTALEKAVDVLALANKNFCLPTEGRVVKFTFSNKEYFVDKKTNLKELKENFYRNE